MKTFFLIAAIVLVCAFAPAALAQVTVQAELGSDRVYVGDSIDLTIHVGGTLSPDRPKVSVPQGIQGEYADSNHSVSVFNGRRTERYSFRFTLIATRPGEYLIPPAEVTVDGKVYRSDPIKLSAVPAPQSDAARLRLDVDKTSLYVGEPTRLRVTWLVAGDVRNFRFGDLDGLNAFDVAHPRARVPTGRQNNQDPNTREFPLFGRTVVASLDQQTIDGRDYIRVTMEQIITPKEPGRHDLGPLSVALDLVVGRRQRDIFSILDDGAVTKRVVAISDPITIDVKPLPTAGQPSNFNGLVGEYSIRAQATPTDVGIGDPITLKLIVDGPEALDRINAPILESTTGFDSFKLSPEGWSASSSQTGAREFTTTIRATSPSVTAIPPVELPYFDTSTGKYSVARSNPIALRVRATRTVTAADAITSGPVGAASDPIVSSRTLESAAPGLPANFESHDALTNQGAGLAERLGSTTVIAVLAAPAAAYLALAGAYAVRRIGHHGQPRLARALRQARRRLHRAHDAPAVADAIRHYVAEVASRDVSTLTGDDCAALLERAGAAAARDTGALLTRCDARRFGGPDADGAALRRQALDLLDSLSRDLRRSA